MFGRHIQRTYRQYVLSNVFLLMCSGDERNILKVFVAGKEIDPTPPVHPPSPGILECHLVVYFEMLHQLIYTVERMVTVKVSWALSCRVRSETDQWQPESGRKQHHCRYWYRPSCTVWYKACYNGISPERLWVHSQVLVTHVHYLCPLQELAYSL